MIAAARSFRGVKEDLSASKYARGKPTPENPMCGSECTAKAGGREGRQGANCKATHWQH